MAIDSDFEFQAEEAAAQRAENEKAAEQVAQLDALVGELKPASVSITDLHGNTTEYTIQQFSNYKTAQVLKMLAKVKQKVDLPTLFSEVLALAKDNTQLACPHCLGDGTTTVFNEANDEVLNRTTMEIGCGTCGRRYYLKDAAKVTTDESKAQRLNNAFEAIPTLMEFAPDLLIEFAALALLTNQELEDAFDHPDGIKKLVKAKEKWLQFSCAPHMTVRIVISSIGALGLNFLVRELGNLDKTTAQLLTNL